MNKSKTASTLLLGLGLVLAGFGCDSYDPDLGDEPFRCGAEEPKCPEGYTCDVRSETEQICVKIGTDIPDRPDAGEQEPDAQSFSCNNDLSIEPNNAITMPTITPIPNLRDDYPLAGLAICPTTDVDMFRFRIDRPGKNIRVDMELEAGHGSLLLDILNASGIAISPGTAVDGNPNLIRAEVLTVAADTYYARVKATPGVENNYSIHIITTGP